MWFVKYLLFFSTAIVSAVGAGAVIAGIIVFLIFNHFLPPIITELIRSNLSFLDALPYQLAILGTVVCLSTLLGCCGAILGGNVGKWLLIMYTIELIIFVALNVHITVVLHLAHKKTSSSGSGAVASPLVMDPRIMLDTEMIDATQSDKLSSHKTDVTHANSFLVRQRRGFASDIFNKAKGAIGSTIQKGTDFAGDVAHTVGDKVNSGVNKVGETIQKGKDFAGDVVHTVGDTVSSGVNKVGETIEGGKNLAINTVGTVEKMGELAWAGLKLAKGGIDLVLSVFIPLGQEEEKAVKWIRPILGMYTPAAFRLTKSPVVMTAWASAIGVEVFFILLNIYLTTTKKRYYDTMEC